MTICVQCNGKKATVGTNDIQDPSGNAETYQVPFSSPGAIPCSQCNGAGYY
jgi:hypothetical protein